jgi:acetolactate synthase-1/2/3 large subunit
MSTNYTGGNVVVDALIAEQVKLLFGVPGAGELDIFNALYDLESIRFISPYFENSAALMAGTHGRLTGEPGIFTSIVGPGSVNSMNGVAQAYTNSSPLIHISGDFRTDDRVLSYHGVDDYDFGLKIFQPITKWSVRIEKTKDISKILSKAFNISKSGRPGPVHIQIPRNILSKEAERYDYQILNIERKRVSDYLIEKAIALIKESNQPLIYAGLGVARSFGFQELVELAEVIGAPVGTTRPASDVISYSHPLCIGNSHHISLGTNVFEEISEDCDVVLAIGTGLNGVFSSPLQKFKNIIHIDYEEKLDYFRLIDTKDYESKIQLFGDIKITLRKIIEKLDTNRIEKKELMKKIEKLKTKSENELKKVSIKKKSPIHPYAVISELRKELNDNAVFCSDVGSSCRWGSRYQNLRPNTLLISGRWDSMGTGLATSIAAKIIRPDKQVVDYTGDHGFLMSPMELGTAVKYDLNILIIIMHNTVSGSIWRHQQRRFGRTFATELFCPDFIEYAESFGAKGINVNEINELNNAINEGLSSKTPFIISVNSDHQWNGVDYLSKKTEQN